MAEDEDDEAEAAEALAEVALAVEAMEEVADAPALDALAKLFSVEIGAVRPVALVQAEPTVMLAPETKLTAAH